MRPALNRALANPHSTISVVASSTSANMPYLRDPVSGRNNKLRELGQTRTENGHLEYKNPFREKSYAYEKFRHLRHTRALGAPILEVLGVSKSIPSRTTLA